MPMVRIKRTVYERRYVPSDAERARDLRRMKANRAYFHAVRRLHAAAEAAADVGADCTPGAQRRVKTLIAASSAYKKARVEYEKRFPKRRKHC